MIGAKPSKKPRALARWRYSVRWALPHLPCPGPRELAAAEVDAGAPCPREVEALWKPGAGYCISIDFQAPAVARRWSTEAKARVRRKNLEKRLQRRAPLFAAELFAREIESRPGYYEGEDFKTNLSGTTR